MEKSQEYAPKKKKYMIEAAAQLYCVPEVEYTLQTYIVEGRQVLVATIEETPHKPVYAKDETGKPLAYLRIKDENILATPIHLRVWQQSDSPRGELIRYTEREQLLLEQLEHGTLLSLNRYCRQPDFHAVRPNISSPNLFVMILWNPYSKIINSTSESKMNDHGPKFMLNT